MFTHISGGILVHSSLQILSKSLRLRFQWEGMRFKPNIPRDMAPSIVPSMQWSHPVPLAEKQPQRIMFPPPCLMVGMVSYSAFFPLKMRQVELMPKSLILVSSDHILSPNPPKNHSSVHWQTSDGPVHVLPCAGGACESCSTSNHYGVV